MIPPTRWRSAALAVSCGLVAIVSTSWSPAPEEANADAAPSVLASSGLARRPGGDTTVALAPVPSFLAPAANLAAAGKSRFYAGKALATQPWVRAPTQTDARDGLGPVYNARSCLACHVKGGRGEAPGGEAKPLFATLVRLGLPGHGPHGEPIPDPIYGTQLQSRSTALSFQLRGQPGAQSYADEGVPPEGEAVVRWKPVPFTYSDGERVELRAPVLAIDRLGYGELHPDVRMGLRHAPSLAGMGLLELVDQADIDHRADPDDSDGDGISGRVNLVWDPESETLRPGRFGHKANQPNLRVQIAAALQGDMGLSSPVFPQQPCTPQQTRCLQAPTGNDANGHEVSEDLLQLLVFFNMSIAVPEQHMPDHPMVARGRTLFADVGCDDCHTPDYVTRESEAYPHLSQQHIWPFSDLLLHDMGAALADGRDDYLATGAEWRTPPLWGVGLARAMHDQVGLLHDGRARTVEEAILWHGGEAEGSRKRFTALAADERRALVAFVRSI